MFTPTLFASGGLGSGRIHNIIYDSYLLLLFLNLIYWACWFLRKNIKVQVNTKVLIAFYIVGVLALGMFSFIMYIIPNKNYMLTTSAVRSIINGEAQEFAVVQEKRIELLETTRAQIILPPLPHVPTVLFHTDISKNCEDWINLLLCRYYQKESVQLE